MMLSRRHFAKTLGSSAFLLPFLTARRAPAAPVAPRNLVIVWSLATNIDFWRPTSAPGQPVAFGDSIQPLRQIADRVVVVDGLTPKSPGETHGTPQALTGKGFGDQGHISVDQFIAQSLGLPAPLLLGVLASGESQFMNVKRSAANTGRLPANDDPRSAFAQLFGSQVPAPTGASPSAAPLPRGKILDLSAKQIRSLQAGLGAEQKTKLDQHLEAIASLQQSVDRPPPAPMGCTKPTLPGNVSRPTDQSQSCAVGEAHRDLMVGALGCGLTQIVGMQWGVSSLEYLGGNNLNFDEHSAVHTSGARDKVVAAEQFLSNWFVGLIQKLAATPDPRAAGKTLIDTTLVLWTRDFGTQNPGSHINHSMPFVLAGAADYLGQSKGGRYLNFGGDNNSQTVGVRHERLLLNICEAMGVTNYAGFGEMSGGDKSPLPQLRR